MTEQTNTPETEELSPEQQAADAELRRQLRIQADEQQKIANDKKGKTLGTMSDEQYRRFVREKYGHDPI
jgi:hypothetical protein